uniref:Uncharacterized protein n=1 Tax=Siphoviridae sp. ctdcr45 TaxID=2825580 RepID=A0A8S5Q7T8_9CAUD|nr:MAG TPA: hypothetical protein [Siphoviridae sp. ctdcr45]
MISILISSLPRGGDPYLAYEFSIPLIRWYVKRKSQELQKKSERGVRLRSAALRLRE